MDMKSQSEKGTIDNLDLVSDRELSKPNPVKEEKTQPSVPYDASMLDQWKIVNTSTNNTATAGTINYAGSVTATNPGYFNGNQWQTGQTSYPINPGQGTGVMPNYLPPNFQQQYPTGGQTPWLMDEIPGMTVEEREAAIEFIEALMFLVVTTLDDCDVPNKGGIMDRTEGTPVESIIDLGDYEIVIRPKKCL